MNKILKPFLPHLFVIISFMILSVAYVSPVLKGKVLTQSDAVQGAGYAHEASEYYKATGEWTGWTNALFGGMPTYMVSGGYTRGILPVITDQLNHFLWGYGGMIFYYLIGMYLLLMALECGIFASVIAAMAYAFFSYNIIIIEVGHISKVYALGFTPIMLAGLVWALRGRVWLGAAVFSIGAGLCFNSGHFQIAYYAGLFVGIFVIFEAVRALREKQIGTFLFAGILTGIMTVLVLATITSRLWSTNDYQKETMRGKSELTSATKPATDGLDKSYAFEYSYGKLESLTLLIPNFSGGGSQGSLDEKSASAKVMSKYSAQPEQTMQVVSSLPTYWGDQRYVAGAVYSGSIILFLFILGLLIAENRYKYPFAAGAAFFMMISWGANFGILNNLLFDYLPLFNKFRSLSMTQALAQMCFATVAGLGLKTIIQNPSWTAHKKSFLISFGITAGLCLLLILVPSIVGLKSENDKQLIDQLSEMFGKNMASANELYAAIIEDRGSMLRSDALRSLFFIVVAAGLIWSFLTQKIKNANLVFGILSFFVLIDLWAVAKRNLNDASFQPKYYSQDELFQASPAVQQIQADKDPNFRAIDMTIDPFNDARPSYFYKNVGGGHPAKLRRYQELIEAQFSKNNLAIYNMLNTKYFIVPNSTTNQPTVQQNPDALGNAWFVGEVKLMNNANEELKSLDKFDPKQTAFADKVFASQLPNLKSVLDSTNKIKLTEYKPNMVSYVSDCKTNQIAIFSEVYYRGGIDWKSFIDGQEVPHFRANYVLRGMNIPAGKHTIVFKFDPESVKTGQKIDFYASIAWVLLIGFAFFMDSKSKPKV